MAKTNSKDQMPDSAMLDITTTLMPHGLARAAAEFAWYSRNTEVAQLQDMLAKADADTESWESMYRETQIQVVQLQKRLDTSL